MPPRKVTALRRATDMLVAMTTRSSSASAVRRDTSSPLRVRSKNPASSDTRCAYSWPRRSATTRSPSRETKKKRTAVASASATATANSNMKARSMAVPPPWLKPWSIMIRNACGRVSVAVEEATSAASQAANRPRWRRTNGQSIFRLPMGALDLGSMAASGRGEASVIRLLSAIRGDGHTGDPDFVAGGIAQPAAQGIHGFGRQPELQYHAVGGELLGPLLCPVLRQGGVHRAGMCERVGQLQVHVLDQLALRCGAQAFGRAAPVGTDQPARTQLDAAVPARDHDNGLVQSLAVD